jgi:HPt (histidine-containing phosphotransfer) domain-containing protein
LGDGGTDTAAKPALPDGPHSNSADSAWPGLDLKRGRQLFADESQYKILLQRFSLSLQETSAALQQAASSAQIRAIAHKLQGAAASLCVADVAQCAAHLEAACRADQPLTVLKQQLQEAIELALFSIARYAPDHKPVASLPKGSESSPSPEGTMQLAAQLRTALRALNADRPDEVEPVLNNLGLSLGDTAIADIRKSVQRYAFRQAEAQIHALAATLELVL